MVETIDGHTLKELNREEIYKSQVTCPKLSTFTKNNFAKKK